MTELVFIVPGRLDQITGGYLFDRHIVEGLRARGRGVRVIELTVRHPQADAATLAGLADGAKTVVDGLALANLGEVVAAHACRLRLVAFVHGPLAQEIGLPPAEAKRAAQLEAALLLRLRGVLCPSRRTAAAVESYGVSRDRIAIVPPGTAKPNKHLRPRRGPIRALLCVANLVPRKGHLVLVQALARIRGLEWRLLCVWSLKRDPATTRGFDRGFRSRAFPGPSPSPASGRRNRSGAPIGRRMPSSCHPFTKATVGGDRSTGLPNYRGGPLSAGSAGLVRGGDWPRCRLRLGPGGLGSPTGCSSNSLPRYGDRAPEEHSHLYPRERFVEAARKAAGGHDRRDVPVDDIRIGGPG